MPRESLIKALLKRRVPHIIGSYFVASITMILFLDWLKINYGLPKDYITLALFGVVAILPSVIILAYFHGAPGKDEWTKIEKIGVPINIIFIFSVLLIGYKSNWWFENNPKFRYVPISKEELNAQKCIFIPYIDCRDEIIEVAEQFKPLLIEKFGDSTSKPDEYEIIQLTPDEKKELYDKLIRKAKTNFHPEYNVFSYNDIVRSYERIAQIPPDFKTFLSGMETHTVDAETRKKMLEPFAGFIPDTLQKIMSQVDNNEYSDQLLLFVNSYKVHPPIGGIEIFSACDFIYRVITDIERDNQNNEINKTTSTFSGFQGLQSRKGEVVSDIIDLINIFLDEYNNPQIIATIESVQNDKVFINIIIDNSLLSNTEMSVIRSYVYQDEESIQARIKHIKEFNECCSNNLENEDCKKSYEFYEWSNEEYEDLLDQSHDFFKGNGIKTMGLNKTILIEEVYDSIAVGKIIKNANTCLKVFPGDILKMEK